jgi:hypothetical protein
MKTSLNLFLLAALFVGVGAALGQTTNFIILNNPSFENPAVPDDSYEADSTPGWASTIQGSALVAIINPGPSSWPSSAPAGMDATNCAQIFAYGAGGGGTVYQDTGVPYQPGATYRLTAAIGRQSNQTFNDNGATLVFLNSSLGVVAAKTLRSVNVTPGGFTDIALNYTATGNEGGNGNILVGIQAPASSDGQTYLDFDNVRLRVIVPKNAPYPITAGHRGTVYCLEDPSIRYDIFLPSAYTTNGTPLPILYTFHAIPGGMVSDFQEVCASLNIITIGVVDTSNNTFKDDYLRQYCAIARDIRKRLLFDPTAEFVGGISGGGTRAYYTSRFRAQHVAGVLELAGWLGRGYSGYYGISVTYQSTDRVQTNLLVARTTGINDEAGFFYNPCDSNYLATCGAVIQDWYFNGGHEVPPDSVKTDCLNWLLSQRTPAGPNDRANALTQAANWRSRIATGDAGTVLRECVNAQMNYPRTWRALQAELVMDDLMTNYNSFRLMSVDNLAQGDFASDMFYYTARAAALATNSTRYLCGLKALTGITSTNNFNGTITISNFPITGVAFTTNVNLYFVKTTNDHVGGIYNMLTNYGYSAPVLQSSLMQTPDQMNLWLNKDVPGLSYTLLRRFSLSSGSWQITLSPPIETNTLWSAVDSAIQFTPFGFYRVSTAPTPTTAPAWP